MDNAAEVTLTLVFEKKDNIFFGYVDGMVNQLPIRGTDLLKVRYAVFTQVGQFIRTLPRPTKVHLYTKGDLV